MYKKVLAFSAATLALFGASNATLVKGKCEEVALQENFDASRYVGTWFEQVRDKGMFFEHYDCSQARYTANADGSIAVLNTELNPETKEVEKATATAKCNGAHCKVYFTPFAGGDYQVLETDYDRYSLVYSCTDLLGVKDEMIWILTREQQLDAEIDNRINSVLLEKVPTYDRKSNVRVTYQGADCKYLQ